MDDTSIPDLSPEEARKREANKRQCRANYLKNRAVRLEKCRQYRLANLEQKRLTDKAYRESHAEKIRATKQAHYLLHREEKCAYQRAYAETHRAEKRVSDALYRAAHLEEHRLYDRLYRERHLEAIRAYQKEFFASPHGREVSKEHARKRRARKAQAPRNDFTATEWRALCKAMGYRCAYCGQKFPFKLLCQDHLIPLSKGGSHTLANILPVCRPCNSRKGTGDVLAPVQPFLLLDEGAAD